MSISKSSVRKTFGNKFILSPSGHTRPCLEKKVDSDLRRPLNATAKGSHAGALNASITDQEGLRLDLNDHFESE